MSATQRDNSQPKTPEPDTRHTAEPGEGPALPNPQEDGTMDASKPARKIEATLARMALVRRHVLSVNGAYPAPDQA